MKLPPFGSISPQLATLVADVPSTGPFVYEIKYDGYRAMAWVEDGAVRMATRRGRDWTQTFREVAHALTRLRAKSAILDGEVAYVDAEGRTDFQKLQNALGSTSPDERGRLVYYVFDLLHLDGVDLLKEPLSSRKELLRALLASEPLPLRMSDDVTDGKAFFREVTKLRLEGIIGKRTDRPYISGRTPDWIKLKCQLRQEFVVVGFTPQKETLSGLGALLIAVREDGALRYAGKVGTGFTRATLRDLEARLAPLVVGKDAGDNARRPTVKTPARVPHVTWVEPELVAEVRFSEWTSEGILRHPAFLGLREDKDPAEVVAEKPARLDVGDPAKRGAARLRRSGDVGDPAKRGAARLRRSGDVAPSHVRSELARYFDAVSSCMSPFLASRPLAFVPSLTASAAAIARAGIAARSGYAIATRAEQLATLAEHATFEVHGWGSREPQIDRPDWILFDLADADADASLAFAHVVDSAFALREALQTAQLEAWVMTTGGRGLRVVVPIARRYDWATVHDAAAAIASIMGSAAQIAIEVGLNAAGCFSRLPYSPSARSARSAPSESPAVAMPIAWADLRSVDPGELTVRTVPKLVAGVSASGPPWADLLQTEQTLPQALLDAARTRAR